VKGIGRRPKKTLVGKEDKLNQILQNGLRSGFLGEKRNRKSVTVAPGGKRGRNSESRVKAGVSLHQRGDLGWKKFKGGKKAKKRS